MLLIPVHLEWFVLVSCLWLWLLLCLLLLLLMVIIVGRPSRVVSLGPACVVVAAPPGAMGICSAHATVVREGVLSRRRVEPRPKAWKKRIRGGKGRVGVVEVGGYLLLSKTSKERPQTKHDNVAQHPSLRTYRLLRTNGCCTTCVFRSPHPKPSYYLPIYINSGHPGNTQTCRQAVQATSTKIDLRRHKKLSTFTRWRHRFSKRTSRSTSTLIEQKKRRLDHPCDV